MPLKSDLRDRMLGCTEELRVIGGKMMSVVPSLATIGIIMLAVYVNFNIQTYFHMLAAAAAKSLQSCPTLCDSMDCSLPGSSTHGISRQQYWSGVHCLLPVSPGKPQIRRVYCYSQCIDEEIDTWTL